MLTKTPRSIMLLKAALPALAEEARNRAAEFEEARHISTDFVDKLKAAGAYHILVDPSQGGLGGSLLDWFEMAVTLAEADASTGWVVGHGAVCSGLVANITEPSFASRVFADQMSSIAWSNLPRVRAEIKENGLMISGRWAFETGCMSATYVGGMLRDPRVPNDQPMEMIVALAPAKVAVIEETWDPMGLLGTGSHDVVFDEVFVPWEQIFSWPDSKVKTDLATSVFAPGTWFISMCAAATHLGLARRAIDEARSELNGKMGRTGEPLTDQQATVIAFEECEGRLFSLRAGVEKALDEIWNCGSTKQKLEKRHRIQAGLACITAVRQSEQIVHTAYNLAGASAILRKSPLQRIYRDVGCLVRHVSVNTSYLEAIGRYRAGQDTFGYHI